MKQKSTIITVLLAVAVLILAVAYAALATQTLTVTGSASIAISDDNFDVEFMDTHSVVSKPQDVVAGISLSDEDNAVLTVSNMTTKGQKVEFKLPIKNSTPTEADVDALLAITAKTAGSDWFTVEADLDNKEALAPGEISNLTVTVTLNRTPITQADLDAVNGTEDAPSTLNTINVSLSATPQ